MHENLTNLCKKVKKNVQLIHRIELDIKLFNILLNVPAMIAYNSVLFIIDI